MRRLLAVALVVIGLGGIGLGILGATVWAPATERSATVTLENPGAAVVIDPGVLYVGGHEGTLEITGASDVTIVPGAPGDIEAYLGGAHYTRVTGVPDWSTLSTEDVQPSGDATVPAPAGADLWPTVMTSASPSKTALSDLWELDGGANPPRPYRALLVMTDGTAPGAQTVTVTWPVEATNEWVPYASATGAVLTVIGLILFVADFSSARARRREAAEEIEDEQDAQLAASPAGRRRRPLTDEEAAAQASGGDATAPATTTTGRHRALTDADIAEHVRPEAGTPHGGAPGGRSGETDETAPIARIPDDATRPISPVADDATGPIRPVSHDATGPFGRVPDDATRPVGGLADDAPRPPVPENSLSEFRPAPGYRFESPSRPPAAPAGEDRTEPISRIPDEAPRPPEGTHDDHDPEEHPHR